MPLDGSLQILACPFCGYRQSSGAIKACKCRNEKCGRTFIPKNHHIIPGFRSPPADTAFITADKIPRGNHAKGEARE